MDTLHIFIAVGFGKYAGSGDGSINGIPTHYALVRDTQIWCKYMPVNKQQVWPGG